MPSRSHAEKFAYLERVDALFVSAVSAAQDVRGALHADEFMVVIVLR
jgi:hypothetical protein